MFGIITRSFIEKVHVAFDELNYHVDSFLSYADFIKKVIFCLNHAESLYDARTVIRMAKFCIKKWKDIENIFSYKLSVWREYIWEGNSIISYCDDDDACGEYYLTNGLTDDYDTIYLTGLFFENIYIEFQTKGGKIRVSNDSKYYLKFGFINPSVIKLHDENDKCIANIVLSEKMEIFLEKNQTPFHIVINESHMEVYDIDYYESLDMHDYIDPEEMIAEMEWDVIEERSEYGVTKLTIYEDVGDLIDILFLFSASTFLLYRSFKKHERIMRNSLIASANAAHMMHHR